MKSVVGPAPDFLRVAPPAANRFSLPVLLLATGLLVTLGFALTQQSSARRERETRFRDGAEMVEGALVDAIAERTGTFETAINFIGATYPTTPEQYRSFFDREFNDADLSELDPGVMFLERVLPDDVAALVARERRNDQPDFTFNTGGIAAGEAHLVTVRAAREVSTGGTSILGLDVAPIQQQLIRGELPRSGFVLDVMQTDTILSLLLPTADLASSNTGLDPIVGALIGPVLADDGEPVGWALWFFDLDSFVHGAEGGGSERLGLNVNIRTDGISEPIAEIRRPASADFDSADLRDSFEVTTHSLTWTIDVWAADGSGTGTGLFDQQFSWQFGLAITALVALAAFWRESHRERLDIAELELEHARTLASTDGLTGLLNRKGLIDLARSLPTRVPATLFFFDLDEFKSVNDVHGHHAGDELLCDVADALIQIVRPGDYVGRLGGDEFVIFVPGLTGDAYEQRLSERIIGAIARIDASVSCSLGVASRSAGSDVDVEEMLRTADRAMYESKRAGGGRFTLSA